MDILATLLLLCLSLSPNIDVLDSIEIKTYEKQEARSEVVHRVRTSAYTNNRSETDTTPNVTASGLNIESKHDKRIIALSKDLARRYEFGDVFQLCTDNNSCCFTVVYEDKMPANTHCVDLFMLSRKEAKVFGVKKANLKLIKSGGAKNGTSRIKSMSKPKSNSTITKSKKTKKTTRSKNNKRR